MNNVIKNLVNAARHFTATDFGVFKICLLAIGILLGSYFSLFFLKYITLVWIIGIAAWIILIIQIIRYFNNPKGEG